MVNELECFFEQYKAIVKQVDESVKKVQQQLPTLVKCKIKCSDCCLALFDLTLIEALYLNSRFIKNISLKRKNSILEIANKIDREIHKLKRSAQNSLKNGDKSSKQILYEMASYKIKCPLLNDDNLCDLYEFRPITCRAYGVPTAFAGQGHTCGFSGFKTGEHYPTINIDTVNKKLYSISTDLVEKLKIKYFKIAEILMPVSMVLLTDFSSEYLGLKEHNKEA